MKISGAAATWSTLTARGLASDGLVWIPSEVDEVSRSRRGKLRCGPGVVSRGCLPSDKHTGVHETEVCMESKIELQK